MTNSTQSNKYDSGISFVFPGQGSQKVGMGKDHTLFALTDGKVKFAKKRNNRSFVSVIPN